MDVSEGRHGFAADMRASVDRRGAGSWPAKPQTGGTFEAKSWAWGFTSSHAAGGPTHVDGSQNDYRRTIARCCSAHRSASLACMNVFASRGRPSTRMTMPVYAR